jgi:hypothetical protein
MTVGVTDLMKLRCSPGMISSGIAFTCRAHLRMFATQRKLSALRLRHLCSQSIASLAIRHWLTAEDVPHSLQASAPLTDPHLKQITLGGRSFHVINIPIFNRDHARRIREDPRMLLRCIVPERDIRHVRPRLSSGDLFAFSVLVANVCHSVADTRRRIEDNAPLFAIAVPPRAIWRQQRPWRGLGRLVLHNPGTEPVHLVINGLAASRNLVVESVTIAGRQSIEIKKHPHNLLYLTTEKIPVKSPRVESPARNASWRVTPGTWSNLWFYEPSLLLAGWLTKGDADQVLESGHRHLIGRKIPGKAQTGARIRIRDLRPIGELLQRIRQM